MTHVSGTYKGGLPERWVAFHTGHKMQWEQVDLPTKTWTLNSGDTKSSRANLVLLSEHATSIIDSSLASGRTFGPLTADRT